MLRTSSTLLGALELEVLDVNHAVLAGSELDEGADGDDAHDPCRSTSYRPRARIRCSRWSLARRGRPRCRRWQCRCCRSPRCLSCSRCRRKSSGWSFPPEPMTSRILSGLMVIFIILGALLASSWRGSLMQGSIISSRIWMRASRVLVRASLDDGRGSGRRS